MIREDYFREEGINSNGYPEGWPSLPTYYLSLCSSTVCASLPAGAAELPTRLMARFTGLGFIDREGPAYELSAIESLNSGFGRLALGHFDEPKAFGAPRVTVRHDIDLVHRTIGLEELVQLMLRRGK